MTKEIYIKNNGRNSRVELLRIISMLLIIYYHAARNGYSEITSSPIVYFTSVFLGSWGLVGVDLFVIISSWYISEKQFDVRRILNIVIQTTTWILGYVCMYVLYCCFCKDISVIETIKNILQMFANDFFQPLWLRYYWFIAAYLFMILLTPLLNIILRSVNKKQAKNILICLGFIVVVGQYNTSIICDVMNFCYIYLFINYIKKYEIYKEKKYFKLKYALLIVFLVLFSRTMNFLIGNKLIVLIMNETIGLIGRHSINALLLATIIFVNVINKNSYNNHIINKLASKTLGVYLFHENDFLGIPKTIDNILMFMDSLNIMSTSYAFIIRSILVAPILFLIGTAIECIRYKTLHKKIIDIIEKKYGTILDRVNNVMNNILS